MKILLTSAGLTTAEIIKAYERLVGKKRTEIKVVAIEDAARAEKGDMTWFEEEKQNLLDNAKSVEVLPLTTQSLEKVLSMIKGADAIYCFGGNTDYLAKTLEATGLTEKLPEILAQKVWVGSSAGSCVLCHKESEQTAREVFQEEPTIDHYLNIVPIVLMPHYHGWFKFGEKEILREAKQSEFPVYALSDHAALKVTGGKSNLNIAAVGEDFYVSVGGELNLAAQTDA